MSHWYVFMVGVAVVTGTAAAPSSFEGNSEEGEEGVEAEGHERVRRASFNSWAGKRNSIESDTITLDEEGLSRLIQDIADSILAQHNSGFDMTLIRGPDHPYYLLQNNIVIRVQIVKCYSFNFSGEKRASFNSWAGRKRASFNR